MTGGGGDGAAAATDATVDPDNNSRVACDTVHIVDLSQNSRTGFSCTRGHTREDVADCVERGIRNALPAACQTAFDVFVPGTAAEQGAWKQFNAMFTRDSGRGYISLQYHDNDFDDALLP